jgi:diaminohydroxyphosphoribosylaminopyrimidine deaminase/5-amino-6-(5-phosphoribosylamino)uracil reductase
MTDPFPAVAGQGLAKLKAAGIEVAVGVGAAQARRLNAPYLKLLATGRPWIIAKWAMTLDGKIADFDRRARWITGEAAREEAHRLRSFSDAVVVGIGTALSDDPALDVRLSTPWPREPLRVVVDSRARLPVTARLIGAGSAARAVVAVADAAPATTGRDPARRTCLRARTGARRTTSP